VGETINKKTTKIVILKVVLLWDEEDIKKEQGVLFLENTWNE
jgi:hypothetical protein